MTRRMQALVLIAALTSAAAFAQAPRDQPAEIPRDAQPALDVLRRYLEWVKAKRWAEVKKLTHPKPLEAIAQRKRRLGNEEHPMAPWYYEQSRLLRQSRRCPAGGRKA